MTSGMTLTAPAGNWSWRLALLAWGILLLARAGPAPADTLKLDNGNELTGMLESVTVNVAGQETKFVRDQITSLTIKEGADALVTRDQGPVAGAILRASYITKGGTVTFDRANITA